MQKAKKRTIEKTPSSHPTLFVFHFNIDYLVSVVDVITLRWRH